MKAKFRFLFLLAPIAGALASCSACAHKHSGSEESAAVVLAPVGPPDRLLVEGAIANPDIFWTHLQRGVGGLVALLPMTLGGLVTSLAAIDPSLGAAIDGASPAYGAAVARGDDIGWAVAVKLTDLAHARAILVDGESARYDGHDAGDWTMLARKGGASPGDTSPQIAISKNGYLVVAMNATDITQIGPYLVRTMPTRSRGTSNVELDVPRAALAGTLHDRLAAAWAKTKQENEAQANEERQKHKRAADFGDPSGILTLVDSAVQRRLTLLADLQNAHISIDADSSSVTLDAALTPNEGDGAASQWIGAMRVGDAAPLLDAPVVSLAILSRSSDADRKTTGVDVESALRGVFGDRLGDADAKLAQAAATDWSASAGDYFTAEVMADEARGAIVRTPTTKPDVAARSIHESCELLERPLFHDALGSLFHLTGSSFGAADIAGVGHATTFSLKHGSSDAVVADWLTLDGTLTVAAGADASALLLRTAHPARTWRDDPTVALRATAFGENVAFATAALPFPARDPNASVFFAWGRDGSRAHASIVGSDIVVREAIRLFSH